MGIVLGILIGATLVTTAAATTGKIQKMLDYTDIKITLDGEEIIPKDANGKYVEPFAIEGTTYLPVRAISNALGLEVGWDPATKTVILDTTHQYDNGKITTPATCEHSGTLTYTCIDCGKIETTSIPALEHKPDTNYVCKTCGISCDIDLELTIADIIASTNVVRKSEQSMYDIEDESKYRLQFALFDESDDFTRVPLIVEILIKNSNNEIVYDAVHTVHNEDYVAFTTTNGKYWTGVEISVDYADILPGSSETGSFTYKAYNDYVYIDPETWKIWGNLPLA
ncbi:MAG: copper amine oxidase N-terminal domain-containing protein [Ruminococcaceae bacterium]|nr:copper amine oxidase N-terminal domain-containing protein [Oscillospiraceae bacterium]